MAKSLGEQGGPFGSGRLYAAAAFPRDAREGR
jgi:hypothetical protein